MPERDPADRRVYREIQAHPIPMDLEAAAALSSSSEALDLFTWLSYRRFLAKGAERVAPERKGIGKLP